MGENAKYSGEVVKIGTCEQMYYLRAEQAAQVEPVPHSLDPIRHATGIRFRFPWPDEDGTAPGSFDPPGRTLMLEGLKATPPEHDKPDCKGENTRIHSQAWRGEPGKEVLTLVVQCDCGALYWVPQEDLGPILLFLDEEAGVRTGDSRTFYAKVAARVRTGYSTPIPKPIGPPILRAVPKAKPIVTRPDKWYGAKYEATKGLDVAALAKLIRPELKAILPAGWKSSVRISRYSGGQSIECHLTAPPGFRTYSKERVAADIVGGDINTRVLPWLSAEAKAIEDKAEAIIAAYNYDGSDPQSDYYNVRFYGNAKVVGGEPRDAVVAEVMAEAEALKDVGTEIEAEDSMGDQEAFLRAAGMI